MKIGKLLLLIFLTLTVVAYNYQFYNIPRYMYVNAYKLEPSQFPPTEYTDVTDDSSFRAEAYGYVLASDIVRYPVEIPPGGSAEWWFEQHFNYSEGDMTIKYFEDFYFLQVRYDPAFYRTSLEYAILWTINIVTAIAWALFLIDLLVSHKKKPPPSERKMEG